MDDQNAAATGDSRACSSLRERRWRLVVDGVVVDVVVAVAGNSSAAADPAGGIGSESRARKPHCDVRLAGIDTGAVAGDRRVPHHHSGGAARGISENPGAATANGAAS